MNKNDLFNAIGELDDDIIERSELSKSYKRPVFIRIIAIAACFCILLSVIAVGLISKSRSENNNSDPENHSQELVTGKPTSEKYKTLDELLSDLSKNDNHSDTLGSGVATSSDSDGIDHFTRIFLRGEYIFKIVNIRTETVRSDSKIQILKRDDDGDYSNIGNTDIDAESFMIHNDILITTDYSSFRFYRITDPSNPSFITEYTFNPWTSAYRVGDELYLIFSDGVCACGWSRTDDVSEFYPSFSRDGEADKWGDEYISILGEPTRVSYIAVMKVSLETFDVIDKRAYYGDITAFDYGTDWFAISTQTSKTDEGYVLNPDVYTFDSSEILKHTGKIDLSECFKREKKVLVSESWRADDINILSILKIDGKFRIIANEYLRDSTLSFRCVLMAMEADMVNERCVSAELPLEYNNPRFNQHLHETGRTILTMTYKNDQETPDTFMFIEFSDERIDIIPSNMIAEHVDGIEDHYSGGITEAIVPMGNGIYIRYNSTPNGWDVYDFSDSKDPKHLHKSTPLTEKDSFNSYSWIRYSENLFGVARCTLAEPISETSTSYYDVYWDIYSFDPNSKTPFTLIESRLVFDYCIRYQFTIKNFDDTYYIYESYSRQIEPVMP